MVKVRCHVAFGPHSKPIAYLVRILGHPLCGSDFRILLWYSFSLSLGLAAVIPAHVYDHTSPVEVWVDSKFEATMVSLL